MITAHSPIVQTGIRVVSPLAVTLGVYLLFAGHNRPGGGFAAGLVFGAVITLRVVANLQRPSHATPLVAFGIACVAAVAVAPMLWGDVPLDQAVVSIEVPLLGKIKSGSALPFDIGVTAIVVGLIIALLDGLSATSLTEPEPAKRALAEPAKVSRGAWHRGTPSPDEGAGR